MPSEYKYFLFNEILLVTDTLFNFVGFMKKLVFSMHILYSNILNSTTLNLFHMERDAKLSNSDRHQVNSIKCV